MKKKTNINVNFCNPRFTYILLQKTAIKPVSFYKQIAKKIRHLETRFYFDPFNTIQVHFIPITQYICFLKETLTRMRIKTSCIL